MSYLTVLNNRIWGVNGDEIYANALGDYSDWTTFTVPSVSTDAYNVDTGTAGSFTGITTYRGSVYMFKKDLMLRMFGDSPINYQYSRVTNLGCIDNRSIKEVNNTSFYLGRDGVYAFNGGLPELISQDLNETYVSGVAGGDNRRYYISLYDGSAYKLYVFDTWNGTWLQEDDLNVVQFAYLDGYLYALASDNKIYKFNSGTETVSWTAITKEFTEEMQNKKGHSKINLRVDLDIGSSISVYTKADNNSWVLEKTFASEGMSSVRIPIRINRADHFQLKISGFGTGKIYATERIFYVGGD
jgi:hypothetical protein